MFTRTRCAIGALVVVSLGCSRATTAGPAPAGVALLRTSAGADVGSASVSAAPDGGVRLIVDAKGLAPGRHGIHVHAVGRCDGATPTPFSSAGGHFNPGGREHGRLNPNGWHAGDLPNLVVAADGTGSLDVVVDSLTISDGPKALFDGDGSAIVIHANEDDERTDNGPSGPGNSGARVACGVFERR